MKIIISPAKQMARDRDFGPETLPAFLPQAERLAAHLRALPLESLKALLRCGDRLAQRSFEEYQTMDLRQGLSPALFSYRGIQYQYMAPGVFTDRELRWASRHLRILSGLYGLLRPFDGVAPYRLEMQAKPRADFCPDLYRFWGDSLGKYLAQETDLVLNLASEEYARAAVPHLGGVRCVTPVFGELLSGRVVEKGVYVKMARGEMVRFLAERQAESLESLRAFDRLGFRYCPERSTRDRPVFLKRPPEDGPRRGG